MQANQDDGMTHEERKRKALAQGALYRLGVMEARDAVRHSLSAESLAKGALSRAAHFATSFIGGDKTLQSIRSLAAGGLGGVNLQSAMPLLITGVSLLSRRWLRKPLLYGGIISAVGGLAYYLSHRPDRQDAASEAAGQDEPPEAP
nr:MULTISPECIES: hypothetical protein [unclassified Herbaspirillum]